MQTDTLIDGALEVSEPQRPAPRPAPRPSYAPFFLALGITMAFWGIATSPIMSAAGLSILAWALWMWLRDIARDWRI